MASSGFLRLSPPSPSFLRGCSALNPARVSARRSAGATPGSADESQAQVPVGKGSARKLKESRSGSKLPAIQVHGRDCTAHAQCYFRPRNQSRPSVEW